MDKTTKKILNFIREIDKFKAIERRIYLQKGTKENDAEHSWHMAMMVWAFSSVYEKPINLEKALKMAIMHDLVEVYTGDTSLFDKESRVGKEEREKSAALKLSKLLPKKLAEDFLSIWKEYEENKTDEAKFVKALDKFHPDIQINLVKGKNWQEDKITATMIKEKKSSYFNDSPTLKKVFRFLLKESQDKKYLKP